MDDKNFANEPQSITELRSDKSGLASDLTVRDTLIAALRSLDSGQEVSAATHVVLIFGKHNLSDNSCGTIVSYAGKASPWERIGLIHDGLALIERTRMGA